MQHRKSTASTTTRICPRCGHPAHSAADQAAWRCGACGAKIPVTPRMRQEYINSFPRRPRLKPWRYVRAGLRLGITLVTALAVVWLCVAAWTTYLSRTSNPGGEILVPVLVYLLMYGGWTLRRLWATYKGEEGTCYISSRARSATDVGRTNTGKRTYGKHD